MFSTIKGDDDLEKAPMKLGPIVSGVKAKRVKGNEKKLMKCFLCYSLHKMRYCPQQTKFSATNKKEEVKPSNQQKRGSGT